MDEKKDDKQQFQFLHEEILEPKRRSLSVSQIIILVTVCAMIFGTVSCLMFFGLMPDMKEFFGEGESEEIPAWIQETTVAEYMVELGEDETISNTSLEQLVEDALKEYEKATSDYISVKKKLSEIGTDMERAMATIVSCKSEDWFSTDDKDKSITSGIILKASLEDGITILTDTESLENNQKLVVYLHNEKGYGARILQESTLAGISLIHIDSSLVSQEVLDELRIIDIEELTDIQNLKGDGIVLIGNPYGTNRYMAYGVLTSIGNYIEHGDVQYELMTTNIVDGGSMNGFVLNMKGELLGMVIQNHKTDKMQQIVAATDLYSLQMYLERMLEGKGVSYIGIDGQEITEDIIQKVDSKMPKGIYISSIDDQSPAFHAGFVRGDILVSMGDTEVLNLESYFENLQKYDVGSIVKFTVMRKGKNGYKPIIYDVEIGSR